MSLACAMRCGQEHMTGGACFRGAKAAFLSGTHILVARRSFHVDIGFYKKCLFILVGISSHEFSSKWCYRASPPGQIGPNLNILRCDILHRKPKFTPKTLDCSDHRIIPIRKALPVPGLNKHHLSIHRHAIKFMSA